MTDLFKPIQVGAITAKNRLFIAPMTRARATRDHVPTPVMAEYYGQRATAGLIVSEATGISREGLGWPYAPGLWSQEQVEAWKPVTAAVHERGGKIVAQLWHMGRAVHSSVTGLQPVAPSAIPTPGEARTYDGKKPYETPRVLEADDITRILDDYEHAARNALTAGFDGVQLHAANGYLIDEFLRDSTNHRQDGYGGSPANRMRFLREATERVIATIGAERTAIRLSPNGDSKGCIDSDPAGVYLPVAELLNELGIAFLELRELRAQGTFGSSDQPRLSPAIRDVFKGPLILNQDYTPEEAAQVVASGRADAISFGRPFISNPDLVHRLQQQLPLTESDSTTWYSQGTQGYTDYLSVA
ncbi:alkene reductase [Burkholderia multivorans]|nr:alkene reductase [Burkholderia multivorans]